MENSNNQTEEEEILYDEDTFISAEKDIKKMNVNTNSYKNLNNECMLNILSLNINNKIKLNKNFLHNYKKYLKNKENDEEKIDISNENLININKENNKKEKPNLTEEEKEKIKNEGFNKIQNKLKIKDDIKNMKEYKKISKYNLPIYQTEDINNIYDLNIPYGNIELKIYNNYEKRNEYFLSNRINLTFNN